MNKLRNLSKPYWIWLSIFIIIPIGAMFILSFLKTEGISLNNAYFTLDNFIQLGQTSVVIGFRNSLLYAFIATFCALLIGYPLAYIISRSKISNRFIVALLLVIPMWSNLLLRTTALGYFFSESNMIKQLFNNIGINFNLDIKGTPLAIIIGLISTYLPFMVLPIYNVLEKVDKSLYDASADLGGDSVTTFFRVTIPLSIKGVTSGIIMVFLPCFSGFAIPRILGNEQVIMIGTVIEDAFIYMDYNFGSLLSMIILLLIVIALFVIRIFDKEGETLI